jgi:hypothetical protein
MAYSLAPAIKQQFFDNNGAPLAGGKLFTYQAGTSTPQPTYTDSSGAVENTNPVILDSSGRAAVWLDVELSYKFMLTDEFENPIIFEDNVIGLLTNDAVETASIKDGAVTQEKIADDAVGADQLRDDPSIDDNRPVTTDHIRDGAITMAKIIAAVKESFYATGDILESFAASRSGWIAADGGTIGSAASGATRANADTSALFTLLWDQCSNTVLPILDSAGVASTRGVSAAADYAANKRLPIPDLRNVFLRGANGSTRTISSISFPAVTLGATTLDKMQGHVHTITSYNAPGGPGSNLLVSYSTNFSGGTQTGTTAAPSSDGSNGTPRIGTETAPVNVGVNRFIKL